MTTITIINQSEGIVELKTNPGCAPVVFLNGVIQNPADYRISGHSVYFSSDPPIKWTKWFAWYPVSVKGHRKWLTWVYRYRTNTYVNHDDWACYEYGDIFDVLSG